MSPLADSSAIVGRVLSEGLSSASSMPPKSTSEELLEMMMSPFDEWNPWI